MLSGLSIPALRHYDESGVLPPAAVDGRSGYRRYTRSQLQPARTVRLLRMIDLPLVVEDADRVVAFYRDVFDVEFAPDHHDGVDHFHASYGDWPGSDFFQLTVWPATNRDVTTIHLGFVVNDLDDIWARAERAGAELVAPPHDSDAMPRNAKFIDPAGNHVMVYQS